MLHDIVFNWPFLCNAVVIEHAHHLRTSCNRVCSMLYATMLQCCFEMLQAFGQLLHNNISTTYANSPDHPGVSQIRITKSPKYKGKHLKYIFHTYFS